MARRSSTEVVTGIGVLAVFGAFLFYAISNTGHGGAGGGLGLVAKFENVGTLAAGSDVRIGGVPVGKVDGISMDPASFQAVVHFTIEPTLKLPADSSAVISTGGLLGNNFLSLGPGGADKILGEGGEVRITQSATNLEDLLGKFIFNVGSLADATQRSLKQHADPAPEKP